MKRVLLLAACGSSTASPPVTTPPPARAVAAASTPTPSPVPEAPPASKVAAPDKDAPPTPPKTYDPKQCKERVATFEKRAMAAYEHSKKTRSFASLTLFADRSDPDLTTPLVVWIVRRNGPEGEFCGAWLTEVVLNGKTVATNDGGQRNAKTLAAVSKRLAKGGTIGVHITPYLPMDTIEPFLVELQKLGPLALSVAVQGAEFAVSDADAPVWARERIRAYKQSPSMKLLADGVRDSVTNCPALKTANDMVQADTSGDKGWIIATEYPKVVAACACTTIDVDALELFTVILLEGGYKSVTEGFLDLKVDPASPTKIASPTSQPFAKGLAKLTREQRRAGVALETGGGSPRLGRCK